MMTSYTCGNEVACPWCRHKCRNDCSFDEGDVQPCEHCGELFSFESFFTDCLDRRYKMQKRGSYYEITTGGWHGENVILNPRVVFIRDVNTAEDAIERLFRKWYGRISTRTISSLFIVAAFDDYRGDWLRVERISPATAHSIIVQCKHEVTMRGRIRGYPGFSGFSSWQTMLRRGFR